MNKYYVKIGIGLYNSFAYFVEGNNKNNAINTAKKQAANAYGVRFYDCVSEDCRLTTDDELQYFN